MTAALDGGAWPVTIAGDPNSLWLASQDYAWAAQGMAVASRQLRASLGDVASWEGQGAQSHSVRVQALAAGYQVGAQALNYGSTTLSNYGNQLEAAQALAVQANSAHDLADELALQVRQAEAALAEEERAAAAAEASRYVPSAGHPGQSVSTPPTSQSELAIDHARYASARLAQLQQEWASQSAHASALAAQARSMAQAAAARAAVAFEEVAALAGNPALHTNTDPFIAYLGVAKPGMAAAAIQGSFNLGGDPGNIEGTGLSRKGKLVTEFSWGGDTQALAALAADPSAGAANRRLASVYSKTDRIYTQVVRKEVAALFARHINANMDLPYWVTDLSPVAQAAVLDGLIKHLPSALWLDALHDTALIASIGGTIFTFLSLAEFGLNPEADADVAAADGISTGAQAKISQAAANALKIVARNEVASASAAVAVSTDVAKGALTDDWDYGQLALDALTFLPGVMALKADFSLYRTTRLIESVEGRLATLDPGSEDYKALRSSLTDLKTQNLDMLTEAKFDAALSFSAGAGAVTWSAASLGLQYQNKVRNSTSRARGRRGRGAPRPHESSVPATSGP